MNALLPLANGWFASLMFLAGIGMLTIILLRRTFRQIGRNRRGQGTKYLETQPRPASQWDGARGDAFARLEREKVHLEEIRREAVGQIDSKILVLQELIAHTEQQIERIESLLEDVRTGVQLEPAQPTKQGAGEPVT